MIRLYLLHGVTGRVEGCCGPWRDNKDIYNAIAAWQHVQAEAKRYATEEGFEANACRPLRIVAADTVIEKKIGSIFRRAKAHVAVCPL